MSIAQAVESSVMNMPAGRIFGYNELPSYSDSPEAVVKAMGRMVAKKRVRRFAKGKFYVPKEGVLGKRKPSDEELIRSYLYKNGKLRGYITGIALYNSLGLTTQIPKVIKIACNGGRQEKDLGTIKIETVVSRALVEEDKTKLLQYLDVLKDIKNIPDADINETLKIIQNLISKLTGDERSQMLYIANEYYSPQVKALLGMLLTDVDSALSYDIAKSLNPTSTYKLNLDEKIWPALRKWKFVNEVA